MNQLATATTLNEVNPTNCPTWTTRFEQATGDDAQAVGGDSGGPAFVDTAEGWKYLGALESAIPAKPGVDYFGIGSSSVGITLLRDLGLVDRYRGTRRKFPH